MEHVENTWQGLEDFLQTAPARDLDIDCTAVGIASVKGPTVHFKEILFLEGEIHEDPETLQSHCASLVALWAAVKAPPSSTSASAPASVAACSFRSRPWADASPFTLPR